MSSEEFTFGITLVRGDGVGAGTAISVLDFVNHVFDGSYRCYFARIAGRSFGYAHGREA